MTTYFGQCNKFNSFVHFGLPWPYTADFSFQFRLKRLVDMQMLLIIRFNAVGHTSDPDLDEHKDIGIHAESTILSLR